MTTANTVLQWFIPTRNSAKWILPFVRAYQRLGINPVYLVDSRSSDATEAMLRDASMRVEKVTPSADRVEAIMSLIPEFCRTSWALRLDDDELPSRSLLNWLESDLKAVKEDAVSLSRRPCLLGRDGVLRYSRAEVFYWNEHYPLMLDPQTRLFRPDRVTYTSEIHTPGFITTLPAGNAPARAYFLHFDWILRSTAERILKLRQYDTQTQGAGTNFANFYLPECLSPERLRETTFETEELAALASDLAQLRALTYAVALGGPLRKTPG